MHGSDRVPDLNIDYERALVGTEIFIQSEMALFYECMLKCARKPLDTADIVREAILRHLSESQKMLQGGWDPVPPMIAQTISDYLIVETLGRQGTRSCK